MGITLPVLGTLIKALSEGNLRDSFLFHSVRSVIVGGVYVLCSVHVTHCRYLRRFIVNAATGPSADMNEQTAGLRCKHNGKFIRKLPCFDFADDKAGGGYGTNKVRRQTKLPCCMTQAACV